MKHVRALAVQMHRNEAGQTMTGNRADHQHRAGSALHDIEELETSYCLSSKPKHNESTSYRRKDNGK